MLKRENLLELSFHESLLFDLPVNIFVANCEGLLMWANKRMQSAIHETERSYWGKHLSNWGIDKWEACQRVIQTNSEETIEEKGPDDHYYLTNRKPIWRKDESSIVGIVGISLDITENKLAQYAAKEEFILNMSHDIITPFCGIIGVFHILKPAEKDPKKKAWLETGLESSNRLMNFIKDIHQMSQVGHLPLEYQTFDIINTADEVLLCLSSAIKTKHLKLMKRYEGRVVYSNRFRIKHVLLNLLGNAIKFTTRGFVSLSIRTTPHLIITVRDTGIGIAKEYHDKIFEKFFKIKPSYKTSGYEGIGKGLYLVKKYVEELKGKIIVRNAMNEGSIFRVEIPLRLNE